jgi:hypothetical protein
MFVSRFGLEEGYRTFFMLYWFSITLNSSIVEKIRRKNLRYISEIEVTCGFHFPLT